MAEPQTNEPTDPIIVVGRPGNDFLYLVPNVEWAIDYMNMYFTSDGSGPTAPEVEQVGRYQLNDLDFFDSAGRQLCPQVEKTGEGQYKITALVFDASETIKERIAETINAAAAKEQELAGITTFTLPPNFEGASVPKLPSAKLPLDEFLAELEQQPGVAFRAGMNCSLVDWLIGRCR